ncbi:predicted RNA binding protein [Pseudozyma hubeiensis SY62]|uniref:Predicted RNA binding protein n=1 Tax=Pseudozyma hubeiensis (strain SY62) TaxID=1305764 RepID=R9NWY6_PSEHS|nr:predicted RNA binding protein [Pseudozyma hubeiensis SY62]GAC93017.1 predicted RNA binding protein [Pseudozyma hubeiensis SY62]
MESKLQSLKVAELKSLLTSAGLAVSGNKPDLIQRLLENPGATASLDGGAAAESAPVAAPAPTAAAPAPAAAAAPTQAAEPTPAPEDSYNTTSASESEETRRQALIVELEKRKARAAKFGQPLGEAEQKLERAIKFGLDAEDAAGVAKLAQPLGAKPLKERKQRSERTEVKKAQESEEEKQERLKRVEEEKEKARRRAERFGLSVDGDGEKKRKAEGGATTNGEKKVKA